MLPIEENASIPRNNTIFFIIPVYNEEKNIIKVIDDIAALLPDKRWLVIAVDDGSRDNSAQLLLAAAERYPGCIQIINHSSNLGVPDALYSGFLQARQQCRENDLIFCNEGDGTSDPKLILRMIQLLEDNHEIVIASRYLPGGGWNGFPLHRQIISRLGNIAFRALFPYPRVTDYSIFYRGFRAGLIVELLKKYDRQLFNGKHFSANTALLLKAFRERPRIAEIPYMFNYSLKKSSTAFRLRSAVRGYIPMILSNHPLLLRRICREERLRRQILPA